MVGNFIADHVRKRDLVQFAPNIQTGVQLHWAIDQFTDAHNIVLESKQRLRPIYKKYSPVLVDLFYDHFLSKNWLQYHHQPLPAFAQNFYALMDQHHNNMPASVQYMMPFMKRYDWLVAYGVLEGMQKVLEGMGKRAQFQSHMEQALPSLVADYEAYAHEFEGFFPELIHFVKAWLLEHAPGLEVKYSFT
jgi:acyl carrier protein phosphodiesterase